MSPGAQPNVWDHLIAAADQRATTGMARRLRSRPADDGLIDVASNDYLSLARDPRLIAAAVQATRDWGTGATASRLVVGALDLHAELEAALAEFVGAESALLFSSGYLANLGMLTALADADTLLLSDEFNHASLIDGCRLSRGTIEVYPHCDVEAVERALARRSHTRALVVTDAVFSVNGELAPLGRLHEVARRHGAVLLIDEAHAIGVVGPGGRGAAAQAGIAGQPDVVQSLTLSKSLGAQGGAVLGAAPVVDAMINTSRSLIFDTGLAPAAAAAARAALDVLVAEPDLPGLVLGKAAALRAEALAAGWQCHPSQGAVVSALVGDPTAALAAQAECARHGVSVACFRPPSVPAGESCLRLTARAGITSEQVAQVGRALRAARSVVTGALGTQRPGRIRLVTGTGTGVGKTIVTAALATLAAAAGGRVTVVKPVQTGLLPGEEGDVQVVARLAGPEVRCVEFHRYRDPLAPEAAARVAGEPAPTVGDLAAEIHSLTADADLVLVEGAGGAMVRFNSAGETFADLAVALSQGTTEPCDVVVVADPMLGTLNHTALTLEALAARELACAGVVLGAWPDSPDLACRQNLVDLPTIIGSPIAGVLPAGIADLAPPEFRTVAEAGLDAALGGRFNGTISTNNHLRRI